MNDMSFAQQNNQQQSHHHKQKQEDPLCKLYQYKEKIQWMGAKLFTFHEMEFGNPQIRHHGQYDIVQVFADGQNKGIVSMGDRHKWKCERPNKYENPENVCWNKDLKVVAALAEGGNEAGRHSEDFILRHVDVLHSTEAKDEDDAQRDLVIISTDSPCGSCYEKESIEKMCNGENKNKEKEVVIKGQKKMVTIANPTPRFRKCHFLFSIPYAGSKLGWAQELYKKYDGRFIPVKCNKLPDANPYQDKEYKPQKNALPFTYRVKKDEDSGNTDNGSKKHPLMKKREAEQKEKRDKRSFMVGQKIDKGHNTNSKENSNQFDRKKVKKAAVEYSDMQRQDTSMDLEAFNEYHDLLYGNEYDYGQLQSAPVSPTLYPTYDEYLFTAVGLLFGIFAICLAMICSYIYGVITGVIGRNMIKERDVDVDLDLDV